MGRSRRPGRSRPRRITLDLVNGVEISTLWENHEIHIVGLNIDIAHPTMTALLEEQKARRQQRGQMIAERLEKARIPGAWEGALRLADGGAVTRGHFAVFWWRPAMRKTMAEVFKNTLPAGKRLRAAAVVYNKTSD
ncbi:metal-dependent phosphoesterases (PHP family) [Klebsiella pneumoniae]|uniref:Metal-dependent phosphoesterases (PHP family) n=1 Tax=Klebsiella pneumoniae TaxID=573 RepID=A0A2X3HK74_KLEPN|nr:metal-dependent phosphoesterases (PHP family) [Klebsiella pneumoniae]